MTRKFTAKENWYFIRQDIVSYSISTFEYLSLCLVSNFNIQSVIYGLFECLVFYVPFWYIRINFADTYHSDSWKHCKMWTRIMLCSGVFVLWLLPVKYSLFNSLFVAFICCLILYLVALESNKKKSIIQENEELCLRITEFIEKSKDPKEKLLQICKEQNIIDRMKPKQIWEWLMDNHQEMEYASVYKLLNRLNKKIKL